LNIVTHPYPYFAADSLYPCLYLCSLRGRCLDNLRDGWWTYQFCYDRGVLQSHYSETIEEGNMRVSKVRVLTQWYM
jgi:Glucosidase II beta subunit-like protein